MRHSPLQTSPVFDDDRAGLTSLTLIERVKSRDRDAWQRLVNLYTPLLRYWCRSWGANQEDTDDILQDVFQAILSSLKDFRRDREGDSFRGWLRGVARNKTLFFFRRRGDQGLGGTDFYRRSLLMPDQGRDAEDEEGQLVGALYQSALKLVRAEFEERTWQAFWLSVVEGKPPTLIAEHFGVSPAAVRQSKSRVLRRLKDVLGELPTAPGPNPLGLPDRAPIQERPDRDLDTIG